MSAFVSYTDLDNVVKNLSSNIINCDNNLSNNLVGTSKNLQNNIDLLENNINKQLVFIKEHSHEQAEIILKKIEDNKESIKENTKQLKNLFKPLHPSLTGPFKDINTGETLTYEDLFKFEQPLLFNLMGGPTDLTFGTNSRKVTVNTGLVQYYKDNELKTFNGTEQMKQEDFNDWWIAFDIWVKFNITNSTTGTIVNNIKTFNLIDEFIIWSTTLGKNFKYLNPFSNISNGIRGFLDNQQLQTGFAFLPLPYSSYELTFNVQHYDKMPTINKINRPFDSGLLLDIQNLSSIPVNGISYDDMNLQGYQLFNAQHPAAQSLLIKYPYGAPDFSWLQPVSPEVAEELKKINPTDKYKTKVVRKNNIFNMYIIYDSKTIHIHKDIKSKYAGGFIGFQYEACQVDYTDIQLSPA